MQGWQRDYRVAQGIIPGGTGSMEDVVVRGEAELEKVKKVADFFNHSSQALA